MFNSNKDDYPLYLLFVLALFLISMLFKNRNMEGFNMVHPVLKGFRDINDKNCYACPPGFKRTLHPISDPKACIKGSDSHHPILAGFADLKDNNCYACPDGYHRTASAINANNACEKVNNVSVPEFTSFHPILKGFKHSDNNCYACPDGFKRTLHEITDAKACGK